MKVICGFLLFAAPLLAQDAFRLEPGEYRWVPVVARRVPEEIDCRFRVMSGAATVHLELLALNDFRLFSRGREHGSVATSSDSHAAELRSVVAEPGEYRVVLVNEKAGPPATVALSVSSELSVATELSPQRRLTVILVSFALFFATITWSGVRLLRAVKR